jgi:hypothetical protein
MLMRFTSSLAATQSEGAMVPSEGATNPLAPGWYARSRINDLGQLEVNVMERREVLLIPWAGLPWPCYPGRARR